MKRRWWFWPSLGLLVIGLGLLLRVQQWRTRVAQAIPERPTNGNLSDVLLTEIVSAEVQARGWQPVAGLARLARLYHANGLLDLAAACELPLTKLEPKNPHWPYLLAQIHGGFGQLEETIPLLRRTLEFSPGYVPAWLRLADCHLKLNALAEAERAYRAADAQDRNNAYAALGLARVYLAAQRIDEARTQLRAAVTHHPEFPPAARLLESLDRQSNAAAAGPSPDFRGTAPSEMPDPWLEDLMNDCLDPYRLSVAAAALVSAGTTDKAQRLLERAIALDSGYAAAHRHLGLLLSRQGDSRRARRELELAARIGPHDAENWNYLIKLLRDTGDPGAAGEALAQGLANCPDSPNLHLEMGRHQVAAGNLSAAMAEFRTAQRLRPEEANACIEIALVHFRLDQLDAGMAEVRRALVVEPNHPVGLVLVARYSINRGDAAAAREWIRRCRLQPKISAPDLAVVLTEFEQAFGRQP